MNEIDTLYELCETINAELSECVEKIRKENGKLSAGDIEYLDKLTHTLKSIKTVVAMLEADGGYSGGYYYESNTNGGNGGGSSGRGMSGRRRASRSGRCSNKGYSREGSAEDFRSELEELMMKAPDDNSRMKIERLMNEMR